MLCSAVRQRGTHGRGSGRGTGRYVASGHVIYARGDELFALPFESRDIAGGRASRPSGRFGVGRGRGRSVCGVGQRSVRRCRRKPSSIRTPAGVGGPRWPRRAAGGASTLLQRQCRDLAGWTASGCGHRRRNGRRVALRFHARHADAADDREGEQPGTALDPRRDAYRLPRHTGGIPEPLVEDGGRHRKRRAFDDRRVHADAGVMVGRRAMAGLLPGRPKNGCRHLGPAVRRRPLATRYRA